MEKHYFCLSVKVNPGMTGLEFVNWVRQFCPECEWAPFRHLGDRTKQKGQYKVNFFSFSFGARTHLFSCLWVSKLQVPEPLGPGICTSNPLGFGAFTLDLRLHSLLPGSKALDLTWVVLWKPLVLQLGEGLLQDFSASMTYAPIPLESPLSYIYLYLLSVYLSVCLCIYPQLYLPVLAVHCKTLDNMNGITLNDP